MAFRQTYPTTQSGDQFVSELLTTINQNSGVDLAAQRASLVATLRRDRQRPRSIMAQLADNHSLVDGEYNRSFVLTQYFGYLRRDPTRAAITSGWTRSTAHRWAI